MALSLLPCPIGYFLADGADMLWNQTLGQAWELLCHHLVVRLGEGETGRVVRSGWGPQSLFRFLSSDFPEFLTLLVLHPPNLGLVWGGAGGGEDWLLATAGV